MIYYALKLHRIVWGLLAKTGDANRPAMYFAVAEARLNEEHTEALKLEAIGLNVLYAKRSCILCELAYCKNKQSHEDQNAEHYDSCIEVCRAWSLASSQKKRQELAASVCLWKPIYDERT